MSTDTITVATTEVRYVIDAMRDLAPAIAEDGAGDPLVHDAADVVAGRAERAAWYVTGDVAELLEAVADLAAAIAEYHDDEADIAEYERKWLDDNSPARPHLRSVK